MMMPPHVVLVSPSYLLTSTPSILSSSGMACTKPFSLSCSLFRSGGLAGMPKSSGT